MCFGFPRFHRNTPIHLPCSVLPTLGTRGAKMSPHPPAQGSKPGPAKEGKVGSTIEDALCSPRGGAGRCPWYRVHPSATIGGAVTTPSTSLAVGVGLVGDREPGCRPYTHPCQGLQTEGARCSVCPLPKNPRLCPLSRHYLSPRSPRRANCKGGFHRTRSGLRPVTIEDALGSAPRGGAGRCPWSRVHSSAFRAGAVRTAAHDGRSAVPARCVPPARRHEYNNGIK